MLEVTGSQITTQDWWWTNFALDLPLLFNVHKIWSVDYQQNSGNYCHQVSNFKDNKKYFRL